MASNAKPGPVPDGNKPKRPCLSNSSNGAKTSTTLVEIDNALKQPNDSELSEVERHERKDAKLKVGNQYQLSKDDALNDPEVLKCFKNDLFGDRDRLDVKIIKNVGEGSHGSVYKACIIGFENEQEERNREVLALKLFKDGRTADREFTVYKELCTDSSSLQYVASLWFFCKTNLDDENKILGLSYFEGWTLDEYMREETEKWKRHKLIIIRKIVEAIKFLSEKGFAHNDLKPNNILIGGDDEPTVRLIDFSCCYHFNEPRRAVKAGKDAFKAPEVLDGGCEFEWFNERSDIFSVGILICTVFLDPPTRGCHEDQIEKLIDFLKSGHPRKLRELVHGMCKCKPGQRFHHDQVIARLNNIIEESNQPEDTDDEDFLSNTEGYCALYSGKVSEGKTL